jgi:hypothetical protein
MAFKTRLYLQWGELRATYIGEIEIESSPVRYGRDTFAHTHRALEAGEEELHAWVASRSRSNPPA